MKLPEYIKINDYVIKLKEVKQLLFNAIYSLSQIEFKILKIYIETNLANDFIRPFKSSTRALILFN